MKRVVIYYSLTDNTKEAAESIVKGLGAELFRIETVKPMPKEMGQQMMFGGMQATFGMRPAIKTVPDYYETYDEIILGTPIWASKSAPAINTLLQSEKIREKIVAVFTFSGGGDNDKCIDKLKKKLPHLRTTVALADRKNELAAENEKKIDAFMEELR